MSSKCQSVDGSTSPTDIGSIDDSQNVPVLKYSYNKNKAKKPRRNKSAFILFSIEKRADLKAKAKNMNSNEMMVTLADLWKNLPKDERDRYELEARNDKIRYHQELETFWKENPSEILQNKTKKNHVKKPCSAYAIFLKEVKEDIKTKQPDLKMADVLKIVSRKWKTLDKAEKAVYQDRAEKEKEASRNKLSENYIKGEGRSEAVLKKKKARQQNEIRKQLKLELGFQAVPAKPLSPPQAQVQALPVTSGAHIEPFDTMFVPELPQLDFNSMINTPLMPSISQHAAVKNDFATPLPSKHFELVPIEPLSVPPLEPLSLAHLIQNSKHSDPPLQNQKSMLTITTNLFPEKAKDDDFLNMLNKSVMTSNELILDLLNFDSNPGRIDSAELRGKSSLRLNSNPFASTLEHTSQPYRSYAPRASRSEILNNAIMSALDFNTLNLPDLRKEDDHPNNKYFDLPLLK